MVGRSHAFRSIIIIYHTYITYYNNSADENAFLKRNLQKYKCIGKSA